MDNNDIEFEIRRMILEMKSGHNDGYVQNHYRKQLKSIQKLVNGALDE
jgi:hypothetical protein